MRASLIAHSTAGIANGPLALEAQHRAPGARYLAPGARYLVPEVRHHAPEVPSRAEREDAPRQPAATVMYLVAPRLGGGRAA